MSRVKYRIRWFRVIVIVLVGYAFYLCIGQQSQLSVIERETEAVNKQLEELKQTKEALIEERQKLNDPAYIEKLARDELGLVKPGEVPYLPAGKN